MARVGTRRALVSRPPAAAVGGSNGLLTGLAAYWNLDEASGNRAASYGGFTLTDNNTVGSIAGVISNGADFVTANSEYLSNAGFNITVSTAFCVSFWTIPDIISSTVRAMIFVESSGGTEFLFMNTSSYVRAYMTAGNVYWAYSASALTQGALHHVIVQYDSSQTDADKCKLYINNVLQSGSLTGTPTTFSNPNKINIGASVSGGNPWDGLIDEVGVWVDVVLTADQRTALYNGGAGLAYSSFTV